MYCSVSLVSTFIAMVKPMFKKVFGALCLLNLLWIPVTLLKIKPELASPINQVTNQSKQNTDISTQRIVEESTTDEINKVTNFAFVNLTTQKGTYFNESSKPKSIASMVKIFVAIAIADGLDNNILSLTDSIGELPNFADTDGDRGDNISQSLYFMLGPSSNSATNALILKAGGLAKVNEVLNKYGITDSNMTCFLSPTEIDDNTCKESNSSTMLDLVKAITIIHKGKGPNFELLRKAMTVTDSKFSHTDRLFNKVGINDTVLGNVGILRIDNVDYAFSIVFDSTDKEALYRTSVYGAYNKRHTSQKRPSKQSHPKLY
jgi:hypothetical protein